MEIHRLRTDDWVRLKQLRLSALRDAPEAFDSTYADAQRFSPTQWRQQIEDLATFVATHDGVDMGMVRGAPDRADARGAFLISMWVAPVARRRGVGKRLIEAVIRWARAAGFERLELDVADDNQAATALYEQLRFLPTGETGSLPPPRSHVREHRRALMLKEEG